MTGPPIGGGMLLPVNVELFSGEVCVFLIELVLGKAFALLVIIVHAAEMRSSPKSKVVDNFFIFVNRFFILSFSIYFLCFFFVLFLPFP